MSGEFFERRTSRTLTDADIDAIASAFAAKSCKFNDITSEDLTEAVNFYKNMNEALTTSRKTLWNTFLVFTLTGILTLITYGAVTKIKG